MAADYPALPKWERVRPRPDYLSKKQRLLRQNPRLIQTQVPGRSAADPDRSNFSRPTFRGRPAQSTGSFGSLIPAAPCHPEPVRLGGLGHNGSGAKCYHGRAEDREPLLRVARTPLSEGAWRTRARISRARRRWSSLRRLLKPRDGRWIGAFPAKSLWTRSAKTLLYRSPELANRSGMRSSGTTLWLILRSC